jgi:hypothetical protein
MEKRLRNHPIRLHQAAQDRVVPSGVVEAQPYVPKMTSWDDA